MTNLLYFCPTSFLTSCKIVSYLQYNLFCFRIHFYVKYWADPWIQTKFAELPVGRLNLIETWRRRRIVFFVISFQVLYFELDSGVAQLVVSANCGDKPSRPNLLNKNSTKQQLGLHVWAALHLTQTILPKDATNVYGLKLIWRLISVLGCWCCHLHCVVLSTTV